MPVLLILLIIHQYELINRSLLCYIRCQKPHPPLADRPTTHTAVPQRMCGRAHDSTCTFIHQHLCRSPHDTTYSARAQACYCADISRIRGEGSKADNKNPYLLHSTARPFVYIKKKSPPIDAKHGRVKNTSKNILLSSILSGPSHCTCGSPTY